jgi:hypothetical protein
MLPVFPCLVSTSALKFKMKWLMQDFCLVYQYAFLLRNGTGLLSDMLTGLCSLLGIERPVVQSIA